MNKSAQVNSDNISFRIISIQLCPLAEPVEAWRKKQSGFDRLSPRLYARKAGIFGRRQTLQNKS
ncbi:MAG: hypothetical protein OXD32_01490 [Endozoicomonadaceae bacterium]|nr:hypothetical protein [Endozoicomonadaceae bacterium]MCY4329846.1 hypothetical protein [Endozoicomonadaceae bacterium]